MIHVDQDEYLIHEVVDRASMMQLFWEEAICGHEKVRDNPKLADMAERINGLMGRFYQTAGEFA